MEKKWYYSIMVDVHTKEQRSFNMSQIRDKNTKPELVVRSLVHRLGYRFRLHRKDLPGKPDIVLKRLKKIIFVHGCYWHLHDCKYGLVTPKTNQKFWQKKRTENKKRDTVNMLRLQEAGWQVLIVWECEISDIKKVREKIFEFLK